MKVVKFLDLKKVNVVIRDQLDDAYHRVIDSGQFVMGSELEAFEEEFARFCEVDNCVGVGNGLDALHLLLKAYNISEGDEVIVPANTFVATWLAVTAAGAIPIPIEPSRETYNLDVNLLSNCLTPKTKAIIAVHLYGQPADMDVINSFAEKNGLIVLEDNAQAQGARYKGRRTGSLGHAAATSFYPGKNLGAFGDGGAIVTNDNTISNRVRKLRNYGSSVKYQHDALGTNSRLDELQAAFLRVKLANLEEWSAHRKMVAEKYSAGIKAKDVILPKVPAYAESVWHLYVIRHPDREQFRQKLHTLGVETLIHYPTPVHLLECYSNYNHLSFPVSEILAKEFISLPISPAITGEELKLVINAISEVADTVR